MKLKKLNLSFDITDNKIVTCYVNALIVGLPPINIESLLNIIESKYKDIKYLPSKHILFIKTKGSAKLHDEDQFDDSYGKKLAESRALLSIMKTISNLNSDVSTLLHNKILDNLDNHYFKYASAYEIELNHLKQLLDKGPIK